MDYVAIYDNLIRTRKERVPADDVYYEKHHIIMKSMGGSNEPENLVKLTAREHFFAHRLLKRIHADHPNQRFRQAAAFAFSMFFRGRRKLNLTSRDFAEMRETLSISQKGKDTSPYVIKSWTNLSETERSARSKKIWDKRRKYKRNCPGCSSEIFYCNLETLKKCESKHNLCESCFEKSDKTLTCPFCQKAGSGNAMKRWHFEKCKKFIWEK